MIEILEWFIPTLSSAYAVYTMVALGNSIIERSGVLNIAIDGLFVLGSSLSYTYAILISALIGTSIWATYIAIVFTSITVALVYSFFMVLNTVLPVSQGAIGLSFMFAGYGLGALVGNIGRIVFSTQKVRVDYLTTTGAAPATFSVILLTVLVVHTLLYKVKLGTLIRAVGEDPRLVSNIGISVPHIRFVSGLIGGALIGLGGALFTLFRVGGWSQGQGLNHGWLAYAISIAGWRYPLLVALVSVFFSSVYTLYPYLQSMGLPVEISNSAPYIVSIATMVLVSAIPRRGKILTDPKSLGQAFFREEKA